MARPHRNFYTDHLPENTSNQNPLQLGFQSRLGAIDAVFVADELASRYAKIKKPLIMTLLDIRKAYDRTPRALIWSKLRRRAVPERVVGKG